MVLKSILGIASMFLSVVSFNVNGATISVAQTYNSIISGAGNTGTFDITSILASAEYSAGFDITSAGIEFSATDNSDGRYYAERDIPITPSVYRNFTGSGSYGYYNYDVSVTGTSDYRSYGESARFESGVDSTTSSSAFYSNYLGTFLNSNVKLDSYFTCGYTYCYNRYYTMVDTYTSGWTGDISAILSLSQLSIDDLSIDGILDFSASADEGNYILKSATLTFEIQTVPLPVAVWLFGSGLLGLVGVARRKR